MIADRIKTGVELMRRFGVLAGLKIGVNQMRLKNYEREGTNIFDREWDLMIILDACRTDVFSELVEERAVDWDVSLEESVGTATFEWIPKTFSKLPSDESVAYVSANPYSTLLSSEGTPQPEILEEVWRYAWDQELGTVRPRPVTDKAISVGRDSNPDRLIVHYLQPHAPFIDSDLGQSAAHFDIEEDDSIGVWPQVQRGDIPRDKAIKGYRKNLEIVLDDVELLLSNINADQAAISSDHGEAFGEHGIYGHLEATDIDCLTHVPWAMTSATDLNEHQPAEYSESENDLGVDERLSALGYV
ncbi:hypothetical protein [Haladaptatus paucihalophilus]|uniref:Sulfatase n=2 Tax=Haladaptatus paucihalophilus DX253 TaxID=797209 RepID=A0A1M6XJ76_HALPU|nr:hypothetical protein [Haladaptatus paucihalophilus]SHL06070.1 hypothetical protein SAMN05444342_2882 [Haladaptatus paucihalophilus DX253]